MPSRGTARLIVLIVLLCACTSDKKDSAVTISGRVFIAGKATPLEDAEVVLPDGTRTKTGPQGAFTGKSKSGKAVSVESAGYAPNSKPAPKGDGYLELYAKPVDAKATVQGSKGGEIVTQDAKVTLPVNALTAKNGKPAREADVEMTVINPTKSTDLSALPGNYDAVLGGKTGKITAESPIHLSAKENGNDLSATPNKNWNARFPFYRLATAIANGKVFHFNEETQQWEVSGRGTLVNTKATDSWFDVTFSGLGWWTVGEFYDQLSCVRGCVVDENDKPASFARAVANGVDHFSQISEYAGADGCFALSVRASAQVAVSVQTLDGFVPARVVMTSAEEVDAEKNPDDCQDLGKLKLEPQEAKDCPQGLEKCASACIDVLSDPDNCSACGAACDGTEGREQSCIAGECACPRGFTTCRGDDAVHCADEDNDVENCGGCAIACEEGQSCVSGECRTPGNDDDAGMDGGIEDGGTTSSCFPDGATTPACEECARSCCSTCTDGCPALLACAYSRCTNPRDCALAQVCPDEANAAAVEAYQAFVSCTDTTCGATCGTQPDASMPDAGPTTRVCVVLNADPQQQCGAPSSVCLGAGKRVQCTLGTTTTVYEWRVTGPVDQLGCTLGCYVDGTATSNSCTYPADVCEGPYTTTKAPCNANCGFPFEAVPPDVEPPNPPTSQPDAGPPVETPTTPGNDTNGVVSCGGAADTETACATSVSQACCISADGVTPSCTSSTACATTRQAACDGPEDCTGGQVCCITDDEPKSSVNAQCLATCPGSSGGVTVSRACHANADCDVGAVCQRSSIWPFWGVCQQL